MKITALAVAALATTSASCFAQGYPQIALLSDSKTVVGEDVVYPATVVRILAVYLGAEGAQDVIPKQ